MLQDDAAAAHRNGPVQKEPCVVSCGKKYAFIAQDDFLFHDGAGGNGRQRPAKGPVVAERIGAVFILRNIAQRFGVKHVHGAVGGNHTGPDFRRSLIPGLPALPHLRPGPNRLLGFDPKDPVLGPQSAALRVEAVTHLVQQHGGPGVFGRRNGIRGRPEAPPPPPPPPTPPAPPPTHPPPPTPPPPTTPPPPPPPT